MLMQPVKAECSSLLLVLLQGAQGGMLLSLVWCLAAVGTTSQLYTGKCWHTVERADPAGGQPSQDSSSVKMTRWAAGACWRAGLSGKERTEALQWGRVSCALSREVL